MAPDAAKIAKVHSKIRLFGVFQGNLKGLGTKMAAFKVTEGLGNTNQQNTWK